VSTVGRVHPHLEAKVIDPGNGKIVPHGTVRVGAASRVKIGVAWAGGELHKWLQNTHVDAVNGYLTRFRSLTAVSEQVGELCVRRNSAMLLLSMFR